MRERGQRLWKLTPCRQANKVRVILHLQDIMVISQYLNSASLRNLAVVVFIMIHINCSKRCCCTAKLILVSLMRLKQLEYILTLTSSDGDTGNTFKDLFASSSDEQSEHRKWSDFLASSIVIPIQEGWNLQHIS